MGSWVRAPSESQKGRILILPFFIITPHIFIAIHIKISRKSLSLHQNLSHILIETKEMKALVKKEPMKGIWMEEVPMPVVGVKDASQTSSDILFHNLGHLLPRIARMDNNR